MPCGHSDDYPVHLSSPYLPIRLSLPQLAELPDESSPESFTHEEIGSSPDSGWLAWRGAPANRGQQEQARRRSNGRQG